MTDEKKLDDLKKMVLRHGTPAAASADQMVVEIRSEAVARFPKPSKTVLAYCIGGIVVEWAYRVPWTEMDGFHAFLKDNEAAIAQACKNEMEGVHYRGTFLLQDDGQPAYRTYFAYDSESNLLDWEPALKKGGEFYDLMTELRSYWARDPNATERRLAAAVTLENPAKPGKTNEFLALTIAAARLPRG